MDVVILIGRVMFSVLFLGAAMGHLIRMNAMAQFAASRGVPQPQALTVISGLLIGAGGLMVLLGVWADLGALFLFVFLMGTTLLVHRFWWETGEARMQMQVQFMKDLSLAGASLMLFAFFATTDVGLTLTGPLF
jgi:uncharacterized membrane protein YphA (DoxX/SURF4 family)